MSDGHGVGWTQSVLAIRRCVRTRDNETHSPQTQVALGTAFTDMRNLRIYAQSTSEGGPVFGSRGGKYGPWSASVAGGRTGERRLT